MCLRRLPFLLLPQPTTSGSELLTYLDDPRQAPQVVLLDLGVLLV